jgi:hypothetical protein
MISRILSVLLTWPATSAGKQLGRLMVPLTRRDAGLIWPLLPILNFLAESSAVRPRTTSSIIQQNAILGKLYARIPISRPVPLGKSIPKIYSHRSKKKCIWSSRGIRIQIPRSSDSSTETEIECESGRPIEARAKTCFPSSVRMTATFWPASFMTPARLPKTRSLPPRGDPDPLVPPSIRNLEDR